MNAQEMQRIDQKFVKFMEFMAEFRKEFEAGRLTGNRMESEMEMRQAKLNELVEKSRLAEEVLANVISATEKTKSEAQSFADQKKAEGMVLWTKASAKFKEIEKFIEEADKKRIKASLKELEAVAA